MADKNSRGSASLRLRVVLIRHGESTNNVAWIESPSTYFGTRLADPPLSGLGKIQASHAGLWLRGLGVGGSAACSASPVARGAIGPINELMVSPMRRALQTAAPIAAHTGLVPRVCLDLFECGGAFEGGEAKPSFGVGGNPRSVIASEFPAYSLPDALTEEGWYAAAATAATRETDEECVARSVRIVARLRERASALAANHTLVLVVHHDLICVISRQLLGLAPEEIAVGWPAAPPTGDGFLSYNSAMTCIDLPKPAPERGIMRFANMVRHLPDDAVAWNELGER